MNTIHKKELTKCEKKLFDALVKRGVSVTPLYSDGHKTVDMAVLPAHLYIEVDDIGHFINPDQIERDLNRNHFSDGDDFRTFYVTNQIIDSKYLDQVADAIAAVAKRRTSL